MRAPSHLTHIDMQETDRKWRLLRECLAEPHWVWQIETFQTDAEQAAFIARMCGRAPADTSEARPESAPSRSRMQME